MKFPTTLALVPLFNFGISAPICGSDEKSEPLLLDGEDKEAVIKVYHQRHANAEIPNGPLKVTKSSDSNLRINFKDTQEETITINCAEAEEENENAVFTEGVSSNGGSNLLPGHNHWTINWDGPNLNLNLPSRASLRFPTFNLEGDAVETS